MAPGRPGHLATRPLTRVLGMAGILTAGLALSACSQPPASSPSGAPQGTATGAGATGTTVQVGGAIDVINARIPAPPVGSATAQAEMTLASTTGPDVLRQATAPAARAITFTSNGHPVPRITIPVADGASLTTGPPYPDRILLTGLRHSLRSGQSVTITLTFAHAGRATLRIPVTPPVS